MTPRAMLWVHGISTIAWALLWLVASFVGWINSVAFVSHMSMAALVYTSAAAWQSARADKRVHDHL